jgi:LPS-assembly protein
MRRILAAPLCALIVAFTSTRSFAQHMTALPDWNVIAFQSEKLGENHWILRGSVEIDNGDTKLYADELEVLDQEHAVARGNVVLTQGNNRIAADTGEFNTKTKLGTFHNATGIANVKPPRQAPPPGIAVPQLANQETDVYFFGETVEKIGFKKYKITNGGFSTCVQPTPRWDLSADTVVLNVDHYTVLRQALLKVKGVPMLYLPFMYYPTKEDDRATGFLIPTYGNSTVRGQTISNAFFWAIDRSQDATIMHDWYSKTGQGYGTEYRFNRGGGSDGTIRAYTLNEHGADYVQPDGSVHSTQGGKSYTVDGAANQLLPGNLRARARVNYFSNIITNQTFNTNVYDASRNTSSYGANVVGAWRMYSLNGTFERTEWFTSSATSGVTGSSPRLSFNRHERPLFTGSPVYFSLGTDAAHLDRQTKLGDTVTDDRSLSRFDVTPQIRYPFKRWPFFTVNTSVGWRDTYYTRSLGPAPVDPSIKIVRDDDVNRQYFSVGAQVVGPVFMRVWDTPGNGYAEKFKHTIEPFLNIQRTSRFDVYPQIVQIDGTDMVYPGTTNYTYGINNRFYAKRKVGTISQAQEIVNVEIRQTYYTQPSASQLDPNYNASATGTPPSNFSPIAINVRVTPTPTFNATLGAAIDSKYRELQTLTVTGNYNWTNRVLTSVGWSHRFFIQDLAGFNDPKNLDHYLNLSNNVHTRDNRFGGIYSFNYDVLRSAMLQQRISGFYNAQCCGIAFEFQRYNFAGLPSYIVPADHRFFLSFTLAGLGNFSPFNGALGGVPR